MTLVPTPSIFVVMTSPGNAKLEEALVVSIPIGDSILLGDGQYLVAFGGSARELSAHLGVTSGPGPGAAAPALILRVDDLYGSAQEDVWLWLSQRLDANPSDRFSSPQKAGVR